MRKKCVGICLFVLACYHALAQSSYTPLNPDDYYRLDRYEIRSGQLSTAFDTNVKPYRREAIGHFLDSLHISHPSPTDRFNLHDLAEDHWEYVSADKTQTAKPVLRYFYKHRSDFFNLSQESFQLSVNPVLHFQVGKDGVDGMNYINTRGIQVSGIIDKKIGFYSFIGENQAVFPAYVNTYIRRTLTVPQEGFWKGFGPNGVDFLTARGHISFQATPHIGLQFGHGKHFIGNGYRSLVLSDFSNNYLFLRINTEVWKLTYTNIFARMTADVIGNKTGLYGTVAFPSKYFTFHRLSLNISKRLNLGLYESITFGDSTGGFDFSYLNPIIFYRGVEQQGGSTGNALLGLDFKWLLFNHISLYGQALLDEFVLGEIRSGQGWWGNKYALQAGLKYVDMFSIPNLDLQLEFNRVRPYTYAHEDHYRSYTHYGQPLAHPLGANFNETLAILRYQPFGRLSLQAKLTSAAFGADTAASNWGHNILLDNRTREQDYGNIQEQGVKTDLLIVDISASFQLWHHLFAEVRHIYRHKQNIVLSDDDVTQFTSAGLRLNIARRNYDF